MSDQPESKANHIVVSQENLIKTAKLARLNLDESEISRFQKQIAEACENFEKIAKNSIFYKTNFFFSKVTVFFLEKGK